MEPKPRRLSDDEKRDWLRLIRSEHLGPITFHHILRYHHGDAARAIAALPDMARRGGPRPAGKLAPHSALDSEPEALRNVSARHLAWELATGRRKEKDGRWLSEFVEVTIKNK